MSEIQYVGELAEAELKVLEAKGTVERTELTDEKKPGIVQVIYTVYVGRVPAEKVADWKREHGEERVFTIEMPVGNREVSVSYFRKPNRIHIARAMTYVMQDKPIEAGESILQDTFLDGDKRVTSLEDKDTDYHVGVAWRLYENTKVFEAQIKNV
jgi:hypothetical protein